MLQDPTDGARDLATTARRALALISLRDDVERARHDAMELGGDDAVLDEVFEQALAPVHDRLLELMWLLVALPSRTQDDLRSKIKVLEDVCGEDRNDLMTSLTRSVCQDVRAVQAGGQFGSKVRQAADGGSG